MYIIFEIITFIKILLWVALIGWMYNLYKKVKGSM